MKSVGVVGQGFVGQAVKEGFESFYKIETYDKFKHSTCESIQDLCEKTKTIFVCVPTPMRKDGSCDTSIVKEVVYEINRFAKNHILVIKSTVPPGTTEVLNKECENLQVVFNPEFLTEANFLNDFKNQNRIIIGGPRPASTKIKNLYTKVFPNVPVIKTGSSTAEMVKYFTNCFLAVKVSFANEFRQFCEQVDVDYDKVVEYGLHDLRLGKTHFASPGPDLKYGFGGSCFPKDINALIQFAKKLNINPVVLEAAWKKNLEVRPEKDWEQLKGRAVSE
tara:strand:- start:48761 stop:49591 length:831 start_codon:yes stop_codon:yes gene_type:complete